MPSSQGVCFQLGKRSDDAPGFDLIYNRLLTLINVSKHKYMNSLNQLNLMRKLKV